MSAATEREKLIDRLDRKQADLSTRLGEEERVRNLIERDLEWARERTGDDDAAAMLVLALATARASVKAADRWPDPERLRRMRDRARAQLDAEYAKEDEESS